MSKAAFVLTLAGLLTLAADAAGAGLGLGFADDTWDGRTVPDGHQCQRFGGGAGSPAVHVTGIPAGTDALVLEFSDRSYPPMDNGGHGKLGYAIPAGATEVTVPSAPAHTTALPEGFWTVAEHGAPGWDTPGAYLPPCSGGKGNAYYVTVRAVKRDGEAPTELARGTLEMGTY